LNLGSKTDVFKKLVTNLKQNGKKQKDFQRFGEEWKGELRDSKSRMSRVKCGYHCLTTHYAVTQ
jgi:hypothetical protein